jgi:predicted nucleic acid-binding Zn ribbon protein
MKSFAESRRDGEKAFGESRTCPRCGAGLRKMLGGHLETVGYRCPSCAREFEVLARRALPTPAGCAPRFALELRELAPGALKAKAEAAKPAPEEQP